MGGPPCNCLRVIHVAEDSDRHETERKVGHIFGASFGSHAMVAYIHCAHDTYGKHSAEKLVTFLGQILDHMQWATYISSARDTYGNQ